MDLVIWGCATGILLARSGRGCWSRDAGQVYWPQASAEGSHREETWATT